MVERRHAGVDLFGRKGDVVLAPEDGTILRFLPFHAGTWAVYLRSMLGDRIVNLGEVARNSWREFGVVPGQTVLEGQPLARVGMQTDGSTMLHLETYEFEEATRDDDIIATIRSGEMRWLNAAAAPASLRDPSAYLVLASVRTHRREQLAGIRGSTASPSA